MRSRLGRNVNKNRARYRVRQLLLLFTLQIPSFVIIDHYLYLFFPLTKKENRKNLYVRGYQFIISALLLLCEYGPARLICILRNRFQVADLSAELTGKLLQ